MGAPVPRNPKLLLNFWENPSFSNSLQQPFSFLPRFSLLSISLIQTSQRAQVRKQTKKKKKNLSLGYFDFDSTTKARLTSQNGVGKNENETQIKILINYSVMPAARWPWTSSAIILDIKPHQNPRSNKSRNNTCEDRRRANIWTHFGNIKNISGSHCSSLFNTSLQSREQLAAERWERKKRVLHILDFWNNLDLFWINWFDGLRAIWNPRDYAK